MEAKRLGSAKEAAADMVAGISAGATQQPADRGALVRDLHVVFMQHTMGTFNHTHCSEGISPHSSRLALQRGAGHHVWHKCR